MTRKSLIVLLLAACAFVGFTTPANATVGWFYCTVQYAGPGGGGLVYVKLTETSTPTKFSSTNNFFVCPAAQQKELLAIFITALTTGARVYVKTDPDVTPLPTISAAYLMPN